ncbi:8263_t:CDS:2, partial [Gigaspora rosea]
REQERVEHESSEHKEVEHIRSEHERSEYEKTRRERERIKKARIQIGSTISKNNNIRYYLGPMDSECTQCGALHWLNEHLTVSSRTRP